MNKTSPIAITINMKNLLEYVTQLADLIGLFTSQAITSNPISPDTETIIMINVV